MSSLPIRRRSCEILEEFARRLSGNGSSQARGISIIAERLRLAEITIRKWCERSKSDPEDLPFEPSGRLNPFDRTADLLRLMVTEGQHDIAVESINWLARELSGVFITNDQLDSIVSILAQAQRPTPNKMPRKS